MMGVLSVGLRQIDGGSVVKQGDTSSLFTFELLDDEERVMTELSGSLAQVRIGKYHKLYYETHVTVVDGTVTFTISKPIEAGKGYLVEIVVNGYVFPSDKSVKLHVVENLLEYEEAGELTEKSPVLTREQTEELVKAYLEHQAVFTFSEVSDVWTIEHRLNRYPAVVVSDSAGTQVFGDVRYLSTNKLEIHFAVPFSGTAVLV
ncbi:hypothetical protein Javan291_0064 [Streptococcus phage Javan291]|uniref:hypothetical protein n=1 Tax=Streptococcus marmotae TaxID=1825069 RepID=UPI0008313687|nr:hypothetical protein [Streptococcus marmotae]QBX16940.1 hypothetical protein Javan291_0064 [Streptococcus phage Javan291]